MALLDAARANSLEQFAPATRSWFSETFPSSTAVQAAA